MGQFFDLINYIKKDPYAISGIRIFCSLSPMSASCQINEANTNYSYIIHDFMSFTQHIRYTALFNYLLWNIVYNIFGGL